MSEGASPLNGGGSLSAKVKAKDEPFIAGKMKTSQSTKQDDSAMLSLNETPKNWCYAGGEGGI
ncbi:MAG: hypothetical protein ACOYU3_09635 [Bacillota bacterium]